MQPGTSAVLADQRQQRGQPEPFLAVLSPQVLGRIMGKAYCSIPVLRVWIVHLFCQLFLKYWVLLRAAFCGIQISHVGVVSCLYNIFGLCYPCICSLHGTLQYVKGCRCCCFLYNFSAKNDRCLELLLYYFGLGVFFTKKTTSQVLRGSSQEFCRDQGGYICTLKSNNNNNKKYTLLFYAAKQGRSPARAGAQASHSEKNNWAVGKTGVKRSHTAECQQTCCVGNTGCSK